MPTSERVERRTGAQFVVRIMGRQGDPPGNGRATFVPVRTSVPVSVLVTVHMDMNVSNHASVTGQRYDTATVLLRGGTCPGVPSETTFCFRATPFPPISIPREHQDWNHAGGDAHVCRGPRC